ncbi:MAG: DUF3846 domain-containing protein [Ruminococcaceae bacterium]|nr:DUF3846 domain-containing protein [Oscillospiraceae bacterium]
MSKIRVLIKQPGEKARWEEIENDYKTMQQIVGGYVERIRIFSDLAILCNEEGKLRDLPYNLNVLGVDFVGTVIFVGVGRREFKNCPADVPATFRSLEVEP